ncbi:MAG: HD domain-containing protein [Syntrophaceae bacterium]|nr:HD domain-containing protein [Syntrophaceae bacterium]
MNAKTVYVKDINPGDRVNDTFLVMEKNMASSQKGNPYLAIKLRDNTGDVDGRVWDNAVELNRRFKRGDIVGIQSRAISYRNVMQLSISDIESVDESLFNPTDYFPSSKLNIEEMFEDLIDFVGTVETPQLKALLEQIFRDEEIAFAFKNAPAAKGFHHFYIGGLLEHTLSVVQLLEKTAAHYDETKRDLIIAGGMLHDIGKIKELSFSKMIDYTDEGRLIGHISLGLELIDEKIARIEDFPEQLAMELRHIILSHHGVLEYGSPKRPKTLEALIVNFIDDLDAKVNAFQTFIESSTDDESDWTPFHRLLERFIYKGK